MNDDITELVEALDRRQKRAGDVEEAAIVSRNDDQTYLVRNLRTNAEVRASKADPRDEFPVGTWVLIARIGASGLIRGGGYMILSAAEQQQKGISGVPNTTTVRRRGVAVLNVVPNPAVIPTGSSSPVEVKIYGTGFTVAPTYESGQVVNSAVPVVTDTLITLQLSAPAGSTLGSSDILLDGRTFPDALMLVASPPSHLWAWDSRAGDSTLYKIRASDLVLAASYLITGTGSAAGIAQTSGGIYGRSSEKLTSVISEAASSVAGMGTVEPHTNVEIYGSNIWWAGADRKMYRSTLAGTSVTSFTIDTGKIVSFLLDGADTVWVVERRDVGFIKTERLYKLTPSTSAVTLMDTSAAYSIIAQDATNIYSMGNAASWVKFNKSTLASTSGASTYSVGSAANAELILSDGFLYGTNNGFVYKITPATMAVAATSASTGGTGGVGPGIKLAADTSVIYAGVGQKLFKFNKSTMATVLGPVENFHPIYGSPLRAEYGRVLFVS